MYCQVDGCIDLIESSKYELCPYHSVLFKMLIKIKPESQQANIAWFCDNYNKKQPIFNRVKIT